MNNPAPIPLLRRRRPRKGSKTMKYKIIIPILGFLALAGIGGSVEGQQALPAPTPSANSSAEKTIIEVKGDRSEALKILRDQGVNAIELKGSSFTLPTVVVDAPTQVDYGEMIVVSASIDKTKFPEGLQKVNYQWTVIEDGRVKTNAVVWPDGTRIFFAAGMKPKVVQVLLDVDCLFGTPQTVGATSVLANAEMDSPNISVTTITIGDGVVPVPVPVPPVPVPTPTPTPTPIPTPPAPTPVVFPDGKYKLSQFSYDLFAGATNLSQAEKTAVAGGLSNNFDTIAAKVAAISDYKDVTKILSDLKIGNDAALTASGVDKTKLVAIKTALSDKLYSLYSTQALNIADDFAQCFREISIGLKAVKGN